MQCINSPSLVRVDRRARTVPRWFEPRSAEPVLALPPMRTDSRPSAPRSERRRRSATSATGARVAIRRVFPAVLAAGLLVAALSFTGSAAPARANSAGVGFGAIPYNGDEQSRCQGLSVGSHIVFPGKMVVATTHAGICGSAPTDINWTWTVGAGAGGHGCKANSTSCDFKAGAATNGYTLVCINGSNVQGAWQSCDYYGVPGKGVGIIEGTVKDKDGGPVAGADVKAYGANSTSTTTGADGYYAMQVKPGSYRIVPSGGPHGKAAPNYIPKFNATTIADGTSGTADFQLQAGVELALAFDKSTVAADGLQVVNGTVTTTEFGKPLGNVGVQLEAMPGETADNAVTAGPRAAVCSAGIRVWPTGTLSDPDGLPVSVTTDATGHYDLAITVGTTPGVWSLEATAKNADGTLSTDVTSASDTKSITFKSLGKVAPVDFVQEFNVLAKSKTAISQISSNACPAVYTLAQTTATTGGAAKLGGLAFGLVNGKDGQSLLVFSASKPPVVNAQGELPASFTANADSLVLDPAEWTGTGLGATVTNFASLQSIMDGGLLPRVPTLAEFDSAAAVPSWKPMSGNEVTIFSPSFEYLGWGYPGIAAAGACY